MHSVIRIWQMPYNPGHVKFDCSQNLANLVVQVASNYLAFFFASLLQAFG